MTTAAKVYGLRRHCFCCEGEHMRRSTVECAVHGPMDMDWDKADGFHCAAGECTAFLPSDEWMRLVTDAVKCSPAAGDSPVPFPLTVTP